MATHAGYQVLPGIPVLRATMEELAVKNFHFMEVIQESALVLVVIRALIVKKKPVNAAQLVEDMEQQQAHPAYFHSNLTDTHLIHALFTRLQALVRRKDGVLQK